MASTATEPGDGQSRDVLCSSCNRFVGPVSTCPYCGAAIEKRASLRAFKLAAVFLATMGLFLLYLMVTRGAIPVIQIGSIGRTMNFAFVRIEGRVANDTAVYREAGKVASVSFTVDDGSGDLSVKAYRDNARELVKRALIPRAGDFVTVEGSLNITADRESLWLASPDSLVITPDLPELLTIDALSPDLEGMNVILGGIVHSIKPPKLGTKTPWTMTMTDGTGLQRVNIWESVYEELTRKVALEPGAVIQIVGLVEMYQEKVQVRLGRVGDLEFLDQPPSAFVDGRFAGNDVLRSFDSSLAKQEGALVDSSGPVVAVEMPESTSTAATRVELQGEDTNVIIVFKPDVAAALDPDWLTQGTRLRVRGLVMPTQRDIQVRVFHPAQIAPAP